MPDVPHLRNTVGVTEARESVEFARAMGFIPSPEVMAEVDRLEREAEATEKIRAELRAKEGGPSRWESRR